MYYANRTNAEIHICYLFVWVTNTSVLVEITTLCTTEHTVYISVICKIDIPATAGIVFDLLMYTALDT